MNRIITGVKAQLVGWPVNLGMPIAILALAFVLNLALFTSIGPDATANSQTFGLVSIYAVFFGIHISAVTQVFAFVVGFGLTRRAFYLSMSALVVCQAFAYGVALTVLAQVEDATDGWGLNLEFFRPAGLDSGSWVTDIAVFAVPFLIVAFAAIVGAVVAERWQLIGMFLLSAAVALVVGGTAILVSMGDWWGNVGDWLEGQSAIALMAGWPLVVAGALALAGYAGMRRMVP